MQKDQGLVLGGKKGDGRRVLEELERLLGPGATVRDAILRLQPQPPQPSAPR